MKIAHDCVTVMGVFWGGEAMADNRTEGAASPLTGPQAFCKRLGDLVLSAAGLLVLSPLLLAVAAAIRLSDGGPVLFTQDRVTKGGRVFRILKFRTMRPASRPGEPEEDRVTRVGRFLRRRWLDELPQLVNVLKGDMSLVGPRPESLADVAASGAVCPDFHRREQVRAGLTGFAQILGRYDTPPREKLGLDLFYIEHFSLGLDLVLLLQTVLLVFR